MSLRSMTGYGQGTAGGEERRAGATARSVNGRYLDVSLRLAEAHRSLEAPLRALVEERAARGRVELTVELRGSEPPAVRVDVQLPVVEAVHEAVCSLAARGLVGAELTLGDLLRLPEVLRIEVEPAPLSPDDADLVLQAAREALDAMVAAREVEGAQLERILDERLRELEGLAAELQDRVAGAPERVMAGLRERLEALLGEAGLDEARLTQEAAILADRGDVREELDRLRAHLEHFRALVAERGSVGKRLDFLGQEILRELNTLGSKARDAETTRLVVAAKAVCEQLREQVQNVE